MLVLITLTLMPGHNGFVKAKNQHCMLLVTKQAITWISIKRFTTVGHFLHDLDFANIVYGLTILFSFCYDCSLFFIFFISFLSFFFFFSTCLPSFLPSFLPPSLPTVVPSFLCSFFPFFFLVFIKLFYPLQLVHLTLLFCVAFQLNVQ